MKSKTSTTETFLLLVLQIILSIYSGFVLSILWKWFIVTLFGLPALTILTAMGLMVVVSYMTKQFSFNETDRENHAYENVTSSFIKTTGGLIIGFIIKSFM